MPASNEPPLLKVSGLQKSLGGKRVVNDVSLTCAAGEVVGLLGPNGAGKTTTLRMCYGFLRPDAGSVAIAGHDLQTAGDAARRALGVCTQDDTFDTDFTVRGNLEQTARYYRPGIPDLAERIEALLDQFGLAEYADSKPDTLSGGYKRRLMIARAVVHNPKVVFLDEPTTGLDPQARRAVWELMSKLRASGMAVVLTTHYMDEAERLSDRLVLLQSGSVRAEGTTRSLLGDLVGEHVVIVSQEVPEAAAVQEWMRARNLTPSPVLDEWHIAMDAAGLAGFVAAFPALEWQSRAVVSRHLRVHLRNWHTAALPPVCEPLIMLLAFGVGLGQQMGALKWAGADINYLPYLAPGILAYTVFMTSFFQSLWSAYMRMHFQKSWEGQLTTQVRLEHVIWGELLWSATLATTYAIIVCGVLLCFAWAGALTLHWAWLPLAIPVLFLAALAFSCVGLLFTATLPSIDHMGLPFFLVILPLGFASSTYFPLPDVPWLHSAVQLNPLHHLCEGLRWMLLRGELTPHVAAAAGLSALVILLLVPLDVKLLRRRVFGDA